MKSNISKILQDISNKKIELIKEYEKIKSKYGFKIIGKKIVWDKYIKSKQKLNKKPLLDTFLGTKIKEIISMPFIYFMIIPTIVLDIFLFIYQQTAIRLYKIPLVKRSDYLIFDRKQLGYLNLIQKINCLYCSYVNGIFQYAVEVGTRTEKYWCPIKSASKKLGYNAWEKHYADYGDIDGFKDVFHSVKEFENIKK